MPAHLSYDTTCTQLFRSQPCIRDLFPPGRTLKKQHRSELFLMKMAWQEKRTCRNRKCPMKKGKRKWTRKVLAQCSTHSSTHSPTYASSPFDRMLWKQSTVLFSLKENKRLQLPSRNPFQGGEIYVLEYFEKLQSKPTAYRH